jgi:hypothetical protein
MVTEGTKPRPESNWNYEAKFFKRRNIQVIAVDPATFHQWDTNLLKVNLDAYTEENDNAAIRKRADSVITHEISRRTMPASPTVGEIKIWLRTVRKWDGRNCVFYTKPVDEDRAADIAKHAMPNNRRGHWFQDLFTDPNNDRIHMEDEWGRPGFGAAGGGGINNKDPIAIARMSEALGEVIPHTYSLHTY